MPVKRSKAKSSKAAAARPAAKVSRKTKILKPEFTPEEVSTFEQQLARHQHSEKAWQRLTAAPDGDDRWTEVEENLVYRGEQNQTEKRWKYFAK